MIVNWPREPRILFAKKLVVVALVPVAATNVKFWNDDCPATPVVVAKKLPEYKVLDVAAMVPAPVQYAMDPTAPPESGA